MIYKPIKYLLANDSDFNTAIGGKIYPISAPQATSPPMCVYSMISSDGNPTKDFGSELDYSRVRVTVMDRDDGTSSGVDSVIDLAEKARAALDKKAGTYNGVEVAIIDFESMSDGVYNYGADNQIFYIELDFEIWSVP